MFDVLYASATPVDRRLGRRIIGAVAFGMLVMSAMRAIKVRAPSPKAVIVECTETVDAQSTVRHACRGLPGKRSSPGPRSAR